MGPWRQPSGPGEDPGPWVQVEGPLPRGVSLEVRALDAKSKAQPAADYFEAFNENSARNILCLKLGPTCPEDAVVILTHAEAKEGHSLCPRVRVEAASSSRCHIVEMFRGGEYSYGRYSITRLLLEEEATLTHTKIQLEGPRAQHYGKVEATLREGASLKSFTLSCGAALARNNIHLYLEAPGARGELYGAFPLENEQHGDHYVEVHHRASSTHSDQLFKGILAGRSHGAFTGKILVARGISSIDASQLSKNLLLSRKARISTRPELEIDADDVRCTHGATVGHLQEEEMFYLTARGIPRESARRLLGLAFARDVILRQDCLEVRQLLESALESRQLA